MTLFLVELTPELAWHIARGLELRRGELQQMGVRDPSLAEVEAVFRKGQDGSRPGQDGSHWPPAAPEAHARPVRMMLTIDEAADELRVSASTVKRLVRAGALPTVKVEGTTRVRRQDLEAYVAALGPRPLAERVTTKKVSR